MLYYGKKCSLETLISNEKYTKVHYQIRKLRNVFLGVSSRIVDEANEV